MTDIQIKTYEPGIAGVTRSNLDIVVNGAEYSVIWDDEEAHPQFLGQPFLENDEALYNEVKARLELFFTFFEHQALADYIVTLTEQANGAMEQHLAQVAAGEAPAKPLTTAEKIAAIEASSVHIAWDGCHKIYLLTTPVELADAQDTGYSIYPASFIREAITGSCGLVFVSKWGLTDGNWDSPWTIDQCTEDIYEAAEGTA